MSAGDIERQSGRFITLEGGEGVGKTTNVGFVCDWLTARGIEVVRTREPGGTPGAEAIRELLLDPSREEAWSDDAELLLVFAARAQHLAERIRPALDRGAWVVCDRFTDATFAYQGGGRGLDFERIRTLETLVQNGLQPDLTLLLDVPISVAAQRVARRGAQLDRFERERETFFEAVRAAYLARADSHDRFAIIDASPELAAVQQAIEQCLSERVAAWL
ncbi:MULTISPECIES: dTMP kinase [Salinicola]|uniref:Thymidylate kinase n=1 Tax=Salinicola socius TaxID=404433 RepID=A0A1Q8SW38_9GAMM|nr:MULTISPECIES: dTMP kinase [Salinicola]OLO05650.1 dTMP kinase [Salinicola socius]